jgi:hypothetical protein
MRSMCAVLVLVLVLVLAACRGDEKTTVRAEPATVTAQTALVVRGGRLVEIDVRTLKPLPGRAVHLRGHNGGIGPAPDGARVALGGAKSVRIVDLTSFEVVADLPKPRGYSRIVSWGDPDWIVVVSEVFWRDRVDVLVLDAESGQRLSRRPFAVEGGWPWAAQAAGGNVAFLLHPFGGVGPTRLVHVDRSGRSRLYRLDRIVSGNEWTEESSVTREIWPALELDGEGRHAYVVGADDLVADVDLERGRVEYHSLEPSPSLATRLWNWLEPDAEAKASDWTQLGALWLGEGRLAVYGMQTVPLIDGDTHHEVGEALGFRLVDTTDWSVRMVNDQIIWMDRWGDTLLAYGDLWSSVTEQYSGIGLRAYDLDGDEVFHVFDDQRVRTAAIVGDRVIARLGEAMTPVAVEVRTGRVQREPLAPASVPDHVVVPDDP